MSTDSHQSTGTHSVPLRSSVGLLSRATLADGAVVDLRLADGLVQTVAPAGSLTPRPGEAVLDLAGYLLITAPAEPHAHVDKALTFDVIQPPLGDLERAIASFHEFSEQEARDSIVDRARRMLRAMLANGTTAVRSHVNFFSGEHPLRGIEAMVQVRDEFAGLLDLELVTLPGWDVPDALIEAALDAGADLIGGAPHLAPDPALDLGRLLDIAERRGVGIDLHTDESLDGVVTLDAYAERTREWPVSKSAGHCVRLGAMEAAELQPIIAAVRAADIGIISLPITNLYLQGWQYPTRTPRGLTALRELLDGGVRVAAGADNVRDPFNPVGRGDALETASLLVTAGHLSLEEALYLVTDGARAVMNLPLAGPREGAAAELLAVRAATLGEAIAFASPDRYVIHAGALVAESHLDTRVAAPQLQPAEGMATV